MPKKGERKNPKTHAQIYAGPTVCDCGAVLGIEEWTCGACGADPLDEREHDSPDDYEGQDSHG